MEIKLYGAIHKETGELFKSVKGVYAWSELSYVELAVTKSLKFHEKYSFESNKRRAKKLYKYVEIKMEVVGDV